LVFLEGIHNLPITFSLANLTSLTFQNVGEHEVTIVCLNDGKLVLINIETVSISNTTMIDCYGNTISANYVTIADIAIRGFIKNSTETAFNFVDIQNLDVISCTFTLITATKLPALSCAVLDVVSSNVNFYHSVFEQNSAESDGNPGSVLCASHSNVVIEGSTFTNNSVIDQASLSSTLLISHSNITIQQSSFSGNKANAGGAVYVEKSIIVITETTFADNHVKMGGVFTDEANLTLDSSTCIHNQAERVELYTSKMRPVCQPWTPHFTTTVQPMAVWHFSSLKLSIT